jgi:sigma-B regulation protein RsbU (phosphoserine phosphatase)
MRIVRPATKWGRVTVWLGILCVLLWTARTLGAKVGGWAVFTTIVFAFCGMVLGFRVVIRPLLWRLRNRLVVTYLFIGVMPILLLLLMGGLAGYLFAGQFATYVAFSDLNSELQHLQAANDSLAAQLFPLESSGKVNEKIAGEFTRASDERFPGRTVTVSRSGKGFVLATGGELLSTPPAQVPGFIHADFTGFVLDRDALHLRAIRLQGDGDRRIALISDIPVTPNLLFPTAARLGAVTLYPPPPDQKGDIHYPNLADSRAPVTAGQVPPRSHWFDITLDFPTLFNVVDWQNGKNQEQGLIDVATRPSMLYAILFATLGDNYLMFRDGLLAIAIFFAIIEFVALYIGVRLSRSMTASVAEIYRATEHVNRGDLTHRIQLGGRDQMAALGQSFNSMTGSLAKLIEEQKEKQRLRSAGIVISSPAPRPALAPSPRCLRSGAHRKRRLLRLYSSRERSAGRRGRRHQWERNLGCPADGHRACLRSRLFAGTGDGADACLTCLWIAGRSAHVLPRGWERGIAGGPGNANDHLELSALSQHAGGKIRDHVSRLL